MQSEYRHYPNNGCALITDGMHYVCNFSEYEQDQIVVDSRRKKEFM